MMDRKQPLPNPFPERHMLDRGCRRFGIDTPSCIEYEPSISLRNVRKIRHN